MRKQEICVWRGWGGVRLFGKCMSTRFLLYCVGTYRKKLFTKAASPILSFLHYLSKNVIKMLKFNTHALTFLLQLLLRLHLPGSLEHHYSCVSLSKTPADNKDRRVSRNKKKKEKKNPTTKQKTHRWRSAPRTKRPSTMTP